MITFDPKLVGLFALHVAIYALLFVLNSRAGGSQTLVLAILLIWISCVDVERFEIPDLASFLLAVSGLTFAWQGGSLLLMQNLLAGAFWSAAFYFVAFVYVRLRGWEGLGFGDVKLIAALGIWFGLIPTTFLILGSALAGILVILVLNLVQTQRARDLSKTGIAFGPFLCLSAWVTWLTGAGF